MGSKQAPQGELKPVASVDTTPPESFLTAFSTQSVMYMSPDAGFTTTVRGP